MNPRVKQIVEQGDSLFSKRTQLVSFWQEIADHFYPERADFTASRVPGDGSYAGGLSTSYPLLMRRDLGNAMGTMLRPSSKEWFHMRTNREDVDIEGRRWLERATVIQRRAMYDRKTQFVRATKEGDHDFASFGQCVISVEFVRATNTLLYRCWHLRDVAWCESEDGSIEAVHRKWKPTAYALSNIKTFKIHPKVTEKLTKDPYCEINCRHIVIPAGQYGGEKEYRTKFVSIYIDTDNGHVMEETGVKVMPYVIPRWVTVSGSQYAYSPATYYALPEARLIQAVTFTLLEAGQKATNPPMVVAENAVRGEVDIRAGALITVDAAYDERTGDVIRPLLQDKQGLPSGIEIRNDSRHILMELFYLNKLTLPPMGGPDMTAYEVGQRLQENIRQTLPLFEPMENDYNGALCDATFELMFNEGGFGPTEEIPRSIWGAQIQFRFESPLSDAIEANKAQIFMTAGPMIQQAAALDPTAAMVVDAADALRVALQGIGFPARSMRTDDEVEAIRQAEAQRAQQEQMMATLQGAAAAAKDMSAAQGVM